MSVTQCSEINKRLRAAGVTVHEASGWKTRGNGYTSTYVGGLVHHTATAFTNAVAGSSVLNMLINGRPDLDGPLCNYAGNMDGSLTVVSAGPANHAGASGGRSMGPLPVTTLFNPRALGLEIVYPGTVAMKPAQMRTAQVWARVVADVVGGGDIERVRAHAETSVTGKWDPGYAYGKTIDMAAFRRAAETALQEDDMTPAELFAARLKDGTFDEEFDHTLVRIAQASERLFVVAPQMAQALGLLKAIQGDLDDTEAKILGAISTSAGGTVDVAGLAAALAMKLGPELGGELVAALGRALNGGN